MICEVFYMKRTLHALIRLAILVALLAVFCIGAPSALAADFDDLQPEIAAAPVEEKVEVPAEEEANAPAAEEIVGLTEESPKTVVTGREMFHKDLDPAVPGDSYPMCRTGAGRSASNAFFPAVHNGSILYHPGKAATAGGVSVSGLEHQNMEQASRHTEEHTRVRSDLLDPHTVSHNTMRDKASAFMRAVMREEPLDPALVKLDDAVKNSASSAIYGARAANGVVFITTKTASAEPKVEPVHKGGYRPGYIHAEDMTITGRGAVPTGHIAHSIIHIDAESSHRAAFTDNYRPQFYFRTTDVANGFKNSRPGAETLWGQRSLSASNDPLIVLDGIPFLGNLSNINPSDIKSMDILKDASATATYGAQGANDVVLITTKTASAEQKVEPVHMHVYGPRAIQVVPDREALVKTHGCSGMTHSAAMAPEIFSRGIGWLAPQQGASKLSLPDNEFIKLVGPSGHGKSTTLRIIAGLEEISEGELRIGNWFVNNVPPKDRDIAMVFQNYALYPHMTVYDNMAFGLKLRKAPEGEIDLKVREALSGGQHQRAAIAHTIAMNPNLFIEYEPIWSIDPANGLPMHGEITKLRQRLGTTFIYVTHDQTEALTLGTRIVVMKDGVVQQVNTPQDMFNRPANLFVAGFIGSPQMSILPMDIVPAGVAILYNGGVDVSITGNSTTPARFRNPVASTYKKENIERGMRIFSVASGGTGRTLHPDNMAASPSSYGMTDTMGRMHFDARFAGSSSVPAHVEMMGLLGMGNNPMVGATVAVAVAVNEALNK